MRSPVPHSHPSPHCSHPAPSRYSLPVPPSSSSPPAEHADTDLERVGLTLGLPPAPRAALPPLPLTLLHACLSTLVVCLSFASARALWPTLAALVVVWLALPALICAAYPLAASLLREELRRVCGRAWLQLRLAAPLAAAAAAFSLAAWHVAKRPLGLPPVSTRERLASFGLSDSAPWADVFLIVWLTLVNPLMEEFFWRVYLMQLFLARWRDSRFCRHPHGGTIAAGLAASAFYAAYHVPVVASVAPLPLALLAGVGLVAIGGAFQLLTQRGYLIVSIGLHMSADLVVGMVLADIVWADFPLRYR
ncbi:hypothetical protein AB1Y20_020916 [Prymnesium parvum]|uniref:CAAX prenyl protease 2/Lysostaphin resistance protein A-like domain-containing protein n=1 Tax=Prymnesium parvum TaxID=97485 RepID=A0AB34JJZ4_PRYPA